MMQQLRLRKVDVQSADNIKPPWLSFLACRCCFMLAIFLSPLLASHTPSFHLSFRPFFSSASISPRVLLLLTLAATSARRPFGSPP